MLRLILILVAFVLIPLAPLLINVHAFAAGEDLAVDRPETDLNALLKPGTHRMSMRLDDHTRRFIFVTPASFQPGQALPLVFFFHGAGGTAEQALRTYGWAQKAEAEHFFMIYPEGLPVVADQPGNFLLNPHIWRDERANMAGVKVNDVHFFEVLLEKIKATVPVDPRRIYVTGFSNGAAMSFTLGGHFSDRIAAIAPVSSQSFSPATALARPLPVYYLTGTADPLIPYHGGPVRLPWGNTRNMPPVQETVDLWARLDGCPPQPQVLDDREGVRVLRYGPGKDQAELIFTTVEGNGHHWPGTTEPLPKAVSGPRLDPFNATGRIWEFFRQHPLTGPVEK
jgi:polyhydroxybutyrate depolymerase